MREERVAYLLLLAAAYYEKNRIDRKERERVCGRRDREREREIGRERKRERVCKLREEER